MSLIITDEQNTCMIPIKFLQLVTSIVANSVDTDKLASEKPADLDLHCFEVFSNQDNLYLDEAL